MGYSLKREHVINNAEMLETILSNVKRGIDTKLSLGEGDDISYWQYKMHTILKSAEIYRDIEGGKFAGLRNLVSVKVIVQGDEPALIVAPRIRVEESRLMLTAVRFTERDIIEDLRARPPERPLESRLYEFYPTEDFDPDSIITQAREIDWRLGPNFLQDSPDEPMSVVALDISSGKDFKEAKSSERDLMKRLGFGNSTQKKAPEPKQGLDAFESALDEEFNN